MSRFMWTLLATSPVWVLGLGSAAGATEAPKSLLQLTPQDLATVANPSVLTLPEYPRLNVAQSVGQLRNAPSVSSLDADPLSSGLPGIETQQAPTPSTSAIGSRTRQTLPQVTSVSQLSDVRPTDWAYQALASLVEKYGCIAGYPDGTFRGNRAATRYEMAAALNACLDVISDRFATKEDLAAVQRLAQEFANELAVVKGRVDNLEGRVANLEAVQFATLTKLTGNVVINLSDVLAGDFANPPGTGPGGTNVAGPGITDNPVVSNRTRLNFDTSFTGTDLLRIRLQAGNVVNYNTITNTNDPRLAYDIGTGNAFVLHKLFYRFSPAPNMTLWADANAGAWEDNMFTFNPYFSSGEVGALSRFGRFNPIYRIYGANPAGLTYNWKFAENKEAGTSADFTLGYLGGGGANRTSNLPLNPTNPTANQAGLFGDAYAALAQISVRPIKDLALGVTYVRAFGIDPSGATGTSGYTGAANNPTGGGNGNVESDNLGFQFTYKVIPQFTLSGWVGYSSVNAVQGPATGRNAQLLNWAITAAAPDLWQKGDVAGLIFGQPPQSISNNFATVGNVTAFNTYHLEGFYRFQLTNNISLSPGLITVFNPNNNSANAPIVLGVVRTSFQF